MVLYEAPDVTVEVRHTLSQAMSIHRYSHETPPADVRTLRLTPDRLLYVVRDEETGAAIHWTAVVFDGWLPARFGYDPAVPIIGDSYTDERYRGHRILPHALAHILKDLRQSNLATNAYLLVSPENTASIRGTERAGFRAIARLRAWRFAGLLLWKVQSRM